MIADIAGLGLLGSLCFTVHGSGGQWMENRQTVGFGCVDDPGTIHELKQSKGCDWIRGNVSSCTLDHICTNQHLKLEFSPTSPD